MLWYALAQLFSTFLELMRVVQLSSDEKDLEILILRQQLDVLVRKNAQVIRPSRLERWSLAGLAATLKKRGRLTTTQLGNVIRIVKPETVIKWNRCMSSNVFGQIAPKNSGEIPLIVYTNGQSCSSDLQA